MKKENITGERNSLTNLHLPSLHVGRGVECGSVTVFPVWTDSESVRGIDWAGKGLTIDEVDGGSVRKLRVTNSTGEAQLILEGDILEGGRQDRMAGETTLVMPNESVVIPVNCVEAGRWNSGRGHRSTNLKASYSVREARRRAFKEAAGSPQQAVWNRIARVEEGLGEFSATSNFKERAVSRRDSVTNAKERLARGERLAASEERVIRETPAMLTPLDGQRGVIIAIGGEIVAAEIFGSAEAFAERWEGMAIAAEIDGRFAEPRKASAKAARDFVDAIENATPSVTRKGVFSWEGRGITITGVAQDHGVTEVLQFTATNDNAQVMFA